jgi:hypothetical protein
MVKKVSKKSPTVKSKFLCELCDYSCSRKSELERHFGRKKHIKNHQNYIKTKKKSQRVEFVCNYCDKTYTYQSAISRHMKTCKLNTDTLVEKYRKITKKSQSFQCIEENHKENPEKDLEIKDLKIQILEKELKHKDQIIEIYKTNGNTTNNNNTTNFDNNTFNTNNISINVYLNEHCKDAMNLTDFVGQIKVQLEDIMFQDRTSSAEGLTNILTKQLKDLAPTERPIHCSDQRRQHFYIKEGEEWKQKSGDKEMEKSVRQIQIKQLCALKEWENLHPDFMENDRLQAKYTKFMEKIMYGCGDEKKMTKNVKAVKKNISEGIMIKDAIANLPSTTE